MQKHFGLSTACLMLSLLSFAQSHSVYNLMPVPSELKTSSNMCRIDQQFRVSIKGRPNPRVFAEASRFVRRMSERTGIFLDKQGLVKEQDSSLDASIMVHVQRPAALTLGEDESYTLQTQNGAVRLNAITDLGAIRGLETILQLVSADQNGYYIPGVLIKDKPRFAWRGLLLDVVLHFMPVQEIERTLDGMAAVKMNVLHLHLCNDQGFRVESKTFPRLQTLASDGIYYTQEDIHKIVKYADQRGIRVVPEFVVPAHTTAILTAYPELASIKRNYTLQRYFGVFDPVMDPTNEKLYPFLEKLFDEMSSLFPDAYFHIGGDENTGKDWASSAHIKSFMQANDLRSKADLQTYFNRRILPIIRKAGKIMMGWDEILQPGVPKEVVIQSWRGNEAFYRSLQLGHPAILSYGYYIDLIQPASYHYLNDPLPDSMHLSESEERLILGGEATMWSEMVTAVTVDSRIWPRTAAIAERLWSSSQIRDTDDMYRRLDIISWQLESLGLQHIIYKQALMRQLTNGWDTRSLETLVSVLEPMKIYERNQGDTLYTVFSPFTKLADVAAPDQPVPRTFNKITRDYLSNGSIQSEQKLIEQLRQWKENDTVFKQLVSHSPVLDEASGLSENLSALAEAGLEAIGYIHDKKNPDARWLEQQMLIVHKANEQGGRCEIQVVGAVQKLIQRASGL